MSFSADAIGFFLQLSDELSPALQVAESNYARFVKSLDKYNQKAFHSVNKGMDALGKLVESFSTLPKTATDSYTKAIASLRKRMRPLSQRINIVLTPSSMRGLGKSISAMVSNVLSKVKIRLSATIPLVKSKFFDMSESLRRAYKEEVQPPDMLGRFQNVPRFAEGGVVPGTGDIDDVLAFLTPGEMVLPKDLSEQLQAMAGGAVPAGLAEALANIENIALALDRVGDAAELGLDPKAPETFNDGLELLHQNFDQVLDMVKSLSAKEMPKFTNVVKTAKSKVDAMSKSMEDLNEIGEETGGIYSNLLEKILGQTNFLAAKAAIKSLGDAWSDTQSKAAGLFGELDEGKIMGFQTATRSLAESWGSNAEELSEFRASSAKIAQDAGISLDILGNAFVELKDSGIATYQALLETGPAAALAAESGLKALVPALAAMNRATGLSGDKMAGLVQQMVELNQQTGLGDEFIGSFGVTMAEAASGSAEARTKLGLLGVSMSDVNRAVKEGDVGPALDNMLGRLQEIGESDFAGVLKEAFQVETSTAALKDLAARADDVREAMASGRKEFLAAGGGMKGLADQVHAGETIFKGMSRTVGNFVNVMAGPLIEAFSEVNPLFLLATLHLVKMGFAFVAAAGKAALWALGVQTSAARATAAMAATSVASRGATVAMGVTAAASGTAGVAIAGTTGIVATLGSVFTALGAAAAAAWAAIISPIGLIVIAVVAVVSVIGFLLHKFGLLEPIWAGIKKAASDVFGTLVEVWNEIVAVFDEAFGPGPQESLMDWGAIVEGVGTVAQKIFGAVSVVVKVLIDSIKIQIIVWGTLIKALVKVAGVIFNVLTPVFDFFIRMTKIWISIWVQLVKVFLWVAGTIISVWGGVFDFFVKAIFSPSEAVMGLWETIKNAFSKGVAFVEPLLDGFKAAVSGVADVFVFLGSLVGKVFGGIMKVIKFQIGFMVDLLAKPGEAVMAVWDTIKNAFSKGVAFVGEMMTLLVDFLGISELIDSAKGLFGAIIGIITSPLEALKQFINGFVIAPINAILSWDMPIIPGGSVADILGLSVIPQLAGGGIVRQDMLAQLHANEMVIPLSGPKQIQELQTRLLAPDVSEFRQDVDVTTPQQIEKAILVELPEMTDEPVLSATEETNMLLHELITVMKAQGGGPALPGVRSVRQVGEATRRLSEGNL